MALRGTDPTAIEVFKILKLVSTSDAIADLVREANKTLPEKMKKLTIGTSLDERTDNLREAVNAGYVQMEQVYDLIRDAEENGSQHILYFMPLHKSAVTEFSNMDDVGRAIWRGDWKKIREQRRFTMLPQSLMIGDVRRPGHNKNIPNDWVMRIYDEAIFLRESKQETRVEADGTVVKYFRPQREKAVLVVRWHGFGVLELRVPSGQPQKVMVASFKKLWALLQPALHKDRFREWDLQKARTHIYVNRHENKDRYRLGRIGTVAADGTMIDMRPSDDLAVLSDSPIAERKLADSAKNGEKCRELGVIWLENEAEDIHRDIRVLIGSNWSNEAIIAGSAKPRAVDYVTYRIHEYSK